MSFIHKFEDLSSRQKQIDELRGKRGASEKRIYLDEATNEFDLAKEIEIESKYLIFNPDNTRIRTSVLNHLGNVILKKEEIDPLDEFYQKKEDISTQNFLLNLLLERAKSGASIYKQLERVKNQTEHLLIDSDGVVVDGNRRLASMLWLYQEDSSKFPFKKIKCWALPESSDNRENNQKHETVIHHAESYQEPHSWIDIAYGAYKKYQIDEEPVNSIAKYYKTNAAKIYTHVNTAIAVNKYIEFRKEHDKTTRQYGCSINCVISVYNMFTLDEWYEELNEILFSLGGRRITMIYCTNEWQALDILPDFALHKMKDTFNKLSSSVKEYDHTKVLESYIDRAIKEEYNTDKQRLLSTFFWHNDKLDSVRKTKLVDIAPIFNDIKESRRASVPDEHVIACFEPVNFCNFFSNISTSSPKI